MDILQFKTWLEDAGATPGNDYTNSGGPYEDKIASNNMAKSNPTEPNDDIERKNRIKAKNQLRGFGGISNLLRIKKMKKS